MTHKDHNDHEKFCRPTDITGLFKVLPHDDADQSDNCSGHHHHVNVEETSGTRLLITPGLNLIIPVIQIIAEVFARLIEQDLLKVGYLQTSYFSVLTRMLKTQSRQIIFTPTYGADFLSVLNFFF